MLAPSGGFCNLSFRKIFISSFCFNKYTIFRKIFNFQQKFRHRNCNFSILKSSKPKEWLVSCEVFAMHFIEKYAFYLSASINIPYSENVGKYFIFNKKLYTEIAFF